MPPGQRSSRFFSCKESSSCSSPREAWQVVLSKTKLQEHSTTNVSPRWDPSPHSSGSCRLPIREYVLFALTLPFSVFAIWIGDIPIGSAAAYYGVFLSASILYHLTGLAAGLAAKRWRFATRLTQGMVLLLYLVLPQFSHLGLYFFQYLTVRPVLMDTIIPLIHESIPGQASQLQPRGPVPFFDLEVSPLVFSLALQGLLSLMFLTICIRKWKDAECHILSKLQALMVFILLATLALGTIWPILTGNTELTLPILGTMSGARIPPEVAAALPLLLSCFLLLSAIMLISIVTPTHGEILKGWRRTYRKNSWMLSPLRDEAPAGWFALAIASVAVFALGTEMRELHINGILACWTGPNGSGSRSPWL